MHHDRISKPSAERVFPFEAHELATRVREMGFLVHEGEDRLSLIFENCDVECPLGRQLCSFFPKSYIALFSLPADVPLVLARKAVEAALSKFKEADLGPRPAVRDQQFVVYRAYLGSSGSVSVTQHIVSGGYRSYLKFRAAASLSKAQRDPPHQKVLSNVQAV